MNINNLNKQANDSLFPEFQLGNKYQVDYLFIGRNSDGFHFLFVELESPYGYITKANGYQGNAITKGLEQVSDWERWLEANYSSLAETLEKHKNQQKDLPQEFYKFDKTRMNYAVVAGRRIDFNDTTYRTRWKLEPEKIGLLHYDNLIDDTRDWISGKLI